MTSSELKLSLLGWWLITDLCRPHTIASELVQTSPNTSWPNDSPTAEFLRFRLRLKLSQMLEVCSRIPGVGSDSAYRNYKLARLRSLGIIIAEMKTDMRVIVQLTTGQSLTVDAIK